MTIGKLRTREGRGGEHQRDGQRKVAKKLAIDHVNYSEPIHACFTHAHLLARRGSAVIVRQPGLIDDEPFFISDESGSCKALVVFRRDR